MCDPTRFFSFMFVIFNLFLMVLFQDKNVLVLVMGRVDFDANKKNCGPQIITRDFLTITKT